MDTSLGVRLFIDNACLFMANTNVFLLQTMVDQELHSINHWIKSNVLPKNVHKSKNMLFSNTKSVKINFSIMLDNSN